VDSGAAYEGKGLERALQVLLNLQSTHSWSMTQIFTSFVSALSAQSPGGCRDGGGGTRGFVSSRYGGEGLLWSDGWHLKRLFGVFFSAFISRKGNAGSDLSSGGGGGRGGGGADGWDLESVRRQSVWSLLVAVEHLKMREDRSDTARITVAGGEDAGEIELLVEVYVCVSVLVRACANVERCIGKYVYIYIYIYMYVFFLCVCVCACVFECRKTYSSGKCYGVATISRLLKIIGLFCKIALQKRLYSAKETYSFKEPTNRSHPTSTPYIARSLSLSRVRARARACSFYHSSLLSVRETKTEEIFLRRILSLSTCIFFPAGKSSHNIDLNVTKMTSTKSDNAQK